MKLSLCIACILLTLLVTYMVRDYELQDYDNLKMEHLECQYRHSVLIQQLATIKERMNKRDSLSRHPGNEEAIILMNHANEADIARIILESR